MFGCWQAPAYLQTNWWWRRNLYTGPAPQGLLQHFPCCSFVIYSIVYLRAILALCTDIIQGQFDSHFDACTWFTIKMIHMMMSSNGSIFRVTGPLCGELTGHRWIPLTKGSDVELWCFLSSAPWISGWVNNREAGDFRRHHAHYNVIVLVWEFTCMNECSRKIIFFYIRDEG